MGEQLKELPEPGRGFASPAHFQEPGDCGSFHLLLQLPRGMKAVEELRLGTQHRQLFRYLHDPFGREWVPARDHLHGTLLVVPLLVLEAMIGVVEIEVFCLRLGFLIVQHLLGPLRQHRHELLPEDGAHGKCDGLGIVLLEVVPGLGSAVELRDDRAWLLCRQEENPRGGLLEYREGIFVPHEEARHGVAHGLEMLDLGLGRRRVSLTSPGSGWLLGRLWPAVPACGSRLSILRLLRGLHHLGSAARVALALALAGATLEVLALPLGRALLLVVV